MTATDDSVAAVAGVPLQLLWKALGKHAIVSITDSAGTIIYANELFSRISGYSNEDILGKTHRLVKSSIHSDAFYRQMWETISSGETWEGEVCNRHKSGALYWVWSTVVPILDETGLPMRYVSFRTDITNEKYQLEAMRQLEMTQEELLRLAPFGIARLRERVIVKANEEFHRMLGYADGELIGKKTRAIYHSDEQFHATGLKAYEPLTRGEHVKYEDDLKRKDGTSVYVIAGTCSLSREAPTSETLYIIQDISSHKELEERLAKSALKSEALSQAKTEFTNMVTHELKTPLHGILGSAQLLEQTAGADEAELARELQTSAKRLARIVEEMIQYSSYDLQEVDRSKAVNLSVLLFTHAEKYEIQAGQNGVDFKLSISEALDADYFVDGKYVAKVAGILLDNAVKFTRNGHILMEASLDKGSKDHENLSILIADTGVGMSERILADPFVPFQQDDHPLVRRHDGLGLGLALARKLIDRLDGSIAFTSTLGHGTSIKVTLPIRR